MNALASSVYKMLATSSTVADAEALSEAIALFWPPACRPGAVNIHPSELRGTPPGQLFSYNEEITPSTPGLPYLGVVVGVASLTLDVLQMTAQTAESPSSPLVIASASVEKMSVLVSAWDDRCQRLFA